nr:Gfo/Idh/MocA family oxidoreductase [Novosphingobium terrae]
MKPVRLAVLGAGLIGKRHIEHVMACPEAELAAIVDPSDVGRDMAAALGVAWQPSFAALMEVDRPDGIMISTPNQMHAQNAIEGIEAGVAVLVEKPLADNVPDAIRIVEAGERLGVPVLTGHHRRHNRMIQRAKAVIDSGRLGTVVAAHGSCWFFKPDDYFDIPWRRQVGAGPVFLNLIHDVDNLRYFFGDVESVQAFESNAVRGNPVEETSVILLRFANGVLATITVSDTIVAPWSWELTTGENPVYHETSENCYTIGGTHGSLTVPRLTHWSNPDKRSWWEPVNQEQLEHEGGDPLQFQILNFCEVIRGQAAPVCSGREGLETLRVIEAVKTAARTGALVKLDSTAVLA